MARTPLEEQVKSEYVVLNLQNVGLTSDQFFQLCCDNRYMRFELTAQKELIIMPLPGPYTSRRNAIIIIQLGNWARRDGMGITFDSRHLVTKIAPYSDYCPAVESKHEADRTLIRARSHEVRPRKSRVEIVERDFICLIGNRKPDRDVRVVGLFEQVVRTDRNIE
jgi:Uma2 family endonuclease